MLILGITSKSLLSIKTNICINIRCIKVGFTRCKFAVMKFKNNLLQVTTLKKSE